MVDRPQMKSHCLDESSLLIVMSHYYFLYEFFHDFANDGGRYFSAIFLAPFFL